MGEFKVQNLADKRLVVGQLEVLGDISGSTMKTLRTKVEGLQQSVSTKASMEKDWWTSILEDNTVRPVEKTEIKRRLEIAEQTMAAIVKAKKAAGVADTQAVEALSLAHSRLRSKIALLALLDEADETTALSPEDSKELSSLFAAYYRAQFEAQMTESAKQAVEAAAGGLVAPYIPVNLHALSDPPDADSRKVGDFFTYSGSGARKDGVQFSKGKIYSVVRVNGKLRWAEVDPSDAVNNVQVMGALGDVLSVMANPANGNYQNDIAAMNAYFTNVFVKKIFALEAVINELSAKIIRLQPGGEIRADTVEEIFSGYVSRAYNDDTFYSYLVQENTSFPEGMYYSLTIKYHDEIIRESGNIKSASSIWNDYENFSVFLFDGNLYCVIDENYDFVSLEIISKQGFCLDSHGTATFEGTTKIGGSCHIAGDAFIGGDATFAGKIDSGPLYLSDEVPSLQEPLNLWDKNPPVRNASQLYNWLKDMGEKFLFYGSGGSVYEGLSAGIYNGTFTKNGVTKGFTKFYSRFNGAYARLYFADKKGNIISDAYRYSGTGSYNDTVPVVVINPQIRTSNKTFKLFDIPGPTTDANVVWRDAEGYLHLNE